MESTCSYTAFERASNSLGESEAGDKGAAGDAAPSILRFVKQWG